MSQTNAVEKAEQVAAEIREKVRTQINQDQRAGAEIFDKATATVIIFLPVIFQSLCWMLVLSACGIFAEMWELKSINSLLKSVSSAISMLTIILVFILILFTVNLGVVLAVRSGA